MKYAVSVVALSALLCAPPAAAIVGGGLASNDGVARSVVTVVGSRGNVCTGAVIAPQIVLTAAHCIHPGAKYRIVDNTQASPKFQVVKAVALHPAYKVDAMLAHRATADVALLQLESPVIGKVPAIVGMPGMPVAVGGRFTVAGVGISAQGTENGVGTVRVAGLVVTGKPGALQIRLVDPAGKGARNGLGACTGDSGGPAFEDRPNGPAIIGVISWSTGPNGGDGCGGMTGVTPLTLYRDWILKTARQWGTAL